MKILLLLSNELKQYYLIRELSKNYKILGAVIEDKYTTFTRIKTVLKHSGANPLKIGKVLIQKAKIREYESRDNKIIAKYFSENSQPLNVDPPIKLLRVKNINEKKSLDFIKSLFPDLIVVFGTSLVKNKIASIPQKGIINVHTGLSPYYRGGQCAFWCLYNDEPEYIGVTIHWLNQGIDEGDIILQGRPVIELDDNLCTIECKLAKLAIELLKKAISKVEKGTANRVIQREKGRLYLSRQFTLEKRLELESRLAEGLIKKYLSRKDEVYDRVKIVDD